jgi:hypothetical protein
VQGEAASHFSLTCQPALVISGEFRSDQWFGKGGETMGAGVCWICGKASETGEHRIKKSDLVERFGKGPYRGDDALAHFKDGRVRDLQGPESKLVKYEKNLCAYCNNTFTQPFDKAYKAFIPWVIQNEAEVLKRRVIDFEAVYGTGWADRQRNLFKFFAKCFGCRLDEADRAVPHDVLGLLGNDSFKTELYVTFQVNEDQLLLDAEDQAIGTQALFAHKKGSTGDEVGFHCGNHYGWLTIMYWYNHFPLEPVGAPWIANSKFLYLGWYEPLSSEQRTDLIARLAGLRGKHSAEPTAAADPVREGGFSE